MGQMVSVTAGGGVLFKEKDGVPHVLLIFRRGVWDLPKGKKEEGETARDCARREVSEEVGCPLPTAREEVATTYHEYEREGVRYGKSTHWYPMQTEMEGAFKPEREEGIDKAEWYSLAEARQKVGFENLVDVLDAFERWYENRKST